MATINDNGFLINNNRVFLRSENINVFPCSRRGQAGLDRFETGSVKYYDPEARLNTERTNRLHTAVNGFKDSFISDYNSISNTLVFVLAGYHIEIKNFNPSAIAEALGLDTTALYAHLRLHTNVSLDAVDYFTEMLYRQSDSEEDKNYLDVSYVDGDRSGDFFVGVSFTKELVDDNNDTVHNLPLFSYINEKWELSQTSLLPKIEHGETENSIKIDGTTTLQALEAGETKLANLNVTGSTVISGAARVDNTITAEKLVITNIDASGEEKGEVKTPQLRVNRITSDGSDITIDNKKLIVNRSLEMRAPQPTAEKPNPEPAKATIEKAVIGDLTVEVAPGLKNSTGKITALNLQATNNATIYDLDVGTNIDTGTLKTSNSLTVGSYVNVGSPAIPTQTIGDIVAKNSIFAENHIAAKNTIKAPAIYQTVDSIDKPVPFIDLVEQDSGHWQLRISRVNKVTKI